MTHLPLLLLMGMATLVAASPQPALAGPSLADVIADVQPKMVKIYGAGGFRQLESYQSGFLISADGHVLTVWSYVLDTDFITVTLDDGRKFQAELLGADPRLEIAVLKIEATELPHFDIGTAAEAIVGDRVLAFSNLYGVATGDEPASVQKGIVSAKTELTGRRGAFETPYSGPIYVVDAMTNNPGAAGGALTDREGRLLAMLGKELKNELSSTWLNYAVPAPELVGVVDDIMAGKVRPRGDDENIRRPLDPLTLSRLGIIPVPAVLPKTPPFIDAVRAGTPAEEAGLQPDDLILFVNNRIVPSLEALQNELSLLDRDDQVRLTVQRGQQLIDVTLGGRVGQPQ
ncbi:MAG: S1C family serine protease [Planctomycetes bacterium]|nr:S1C family serine protease [Planctomycetota bacterium]